MTDQQTPPLILVDGSSYLYRAFHALPSLTTKDGRPTGAVRGVIGMLKRILNDYRPSHIAVVFDAKGKTFRDDMFEEYKATRPPMPDDLRAQIEPLHKMVKALGLPMIIEPGVEADDVIGTLSTQASEKGIPVVISTGDKDMAQLVDENVMLINTMSGEQLDPEGVEKKFGVPPEKIIDYLTLMGDKVDNIPGVDKVGPKTAVKWIQQWGGFDEIVEHADEIKGKVGDNLRDALDRLPLSRDLVTIKRDVPLKESFDDLKINPADTEQLKSQYDDLEFRTWSQELDAEGEGTDTEHQPAEIQYECILTQKQLDTWLGKLEQAPLIAFDTETTSLNYMDAEVVGLSFSVKAGEAAYLPVAHDYMDAPEQLDRDSVLTQLRPLLENRNVAKVGHNLKYDRSVLLNHGIELQGIQHDTMLESYVLNSTASRHDLDSLALRHLNHQTIHFEDVAGKGKNQITFNQVSLEVATPYAAEDADICLQLHDIFWTELKALDGQKSVYQDIEIPLVPVLSEVERTGVHIDTEALKQQSNQLAQRMRELENSAFEEAGHEFNLGSPKQLQEILFSELGLPVIRKTPKGQPSTAEDVLVELAENYPLPKLILEHRSLSKLKSTYTDKLPKQVNSRTGRVHTSYHQAVAATGRLSSSDPNLQNIPIRSEEGRKIRQAFIPDEGSKMVAVDYSQVELRIMAHLSGDEGLLEAFAQGKDIHSATAAEVFGKTPDTVSKDDRRKAKAINFGLIYGMSAFGLAKQLGIGRNEAQEYVDRYFERYPGVKAYMDSTREQAKEQGFVETVFGRRLYLPEINSRNGQRRQYAERTAINAPMQGTAADIIKLAMINMDKWLADTDINARMIMQVHDELVFEIEEGKVEQAIKDIVDLMESAAELRVPLVAEAGVGNNWDEAH
ncbi:MAG: DNA polymerase I [bacterium]